MSGPPSEGKTTGKSLEETNGPASGEQDPSLARHDETKPQLSLRKVQIAIWTNSPQVVLSLPRNKSSWTHTSMNRERPPNECCTILSHFIAHFGPVSNACCKADATVRKAYVAR